MSLTTPLWDFERLPFLQYVTHTHAGGAFRHPLPLDDSDTNKLPQAERTCRICLETVRKSVSDDDESPSSSSALIAPCMCDGTMKWIHEGCLNTWLKTKYPLIGTHEVRRRQRKRRGSAFRFGSVLMTTRDYQTESEYKCEICHHPYKLIVSPVGWFKFLKLQAGNFLSWFRRCSRVEMYKTLRRHFRSNSYAYTVTLGHIVYFVLLMKRLKQFVRSMKSFVKNKHHPGADFIRLSILLSVLMLMKEYVFFLRKRIGATYHRILVAKSKYSSLTILPELRQED